jgi:hypothetical protein
LASAAIGNILHGDDIEVAFAQRIVFERTSDDSLPVARPSGNGVGGHDLVAMALPAVHGIEKPTARAPYVQNPAGPGIQPAHRICELPIVVVQTVSVALVVSVVPVTGIVGIQFFGRDAGLNEDERTPTAARDRIAIDLP